MHTPPTQVSPAVHGLPQLQHGRARAEQDVGGRGSCKVLIMVGWVGLGRWGYVAAGELQVCRQGSAKPVDRGQQQGNKVK